MVIYFLRTILQVIVMVEAWTRSGKSAGGRSRVLKRNYFSLKHINIIIASTAARVFRVRSEESGLIQTITPACAYQRPWLIAHPVFMIVIDSG
jgi:hypothetical protein